MLRKYIEDLIIEFEPIQLEKDLEKDLSYQEQPMNKVGEVLEN